MIIGDKTIVRPMEMDDINYLYKWWNNGEALAYSGLGYGFMMSRTALENLFKPQIEAPDMYATKEKMFIICRKSDNEPIGDISYRNWDKRNQSAEIGLEICNPADRGMGYGKDAMSMFIDFMFRQLNLHRIELTTAEANKTAQSLYYKLGFKLIGVIREKNFSPLENRYTNALYMDLLRDEWECMK